MKALLILALTIFAAQTSRAQLCGPDVKHSVKKVDGKSPLETAPPTDKALVYVLAPTWEGGSIQNKVSADRTWIGVNEWKSYFVTAMDPGEHDFCTKTGQNANHLKLELEAGKSYFLKQDTLVGNGVGLKATSLSQITAEDASVLIKKCKRMEFFEKK